MSWIDVPDPQPRQQRPQSSRAEQVTAAAAVYGAAQLGAMRRMAEDQHHWAEVQYLLAIGWSMPQIEAEFARRQIEAAAARRRSRAYWLRVTLPAILLTVSCLRLAWGSILIWLAVTVLAAWRGRVKAQKINVEKERALIQLRASTQ